MPVVFLGTINKSEVLLNEDQWMELLNFAVMAIKIFKKYAFKDI